jgi:hypothetical protein
MVQEEAQMEFISPIGYFQVNATVFFLSHSLIKNRRGLGDGSIIA